MRAWRCVLSLVTNAVVIPEVNRSVRKEVEAEVGFESLALSSGMCADDMLLVMWN